MIRLYLIIAAASLAMSGASFFVGNLRGYNAGVDHQKSVQDVARAKAQETIDQLGEKNAQMAGALLALQREKEGLINELENEAYRSDGADRPGVAATGGLRRLDKRWGQP